MEAERHFLGDLVEEVRVRFGIQPKSPAAVDAEYVGPWGVWRFNA